MKIIKLLTPVLLTALIAVSCHMGKHWQKTPEGMKYRFVIQDKPGRKPAMGDQVKIHYVVKTDSGFNIINTYRPENPVTMTMSNNIVGGLHKALAMMSPGDSAIFMIKSDSFFKNATRLPVHVHSGRMLTCTIKMLQLKTADQVKKEREAAQQEALKKAGSRLGADTLMIREYLTTNKINAQRTASGLYYIIDKPGEGPLPLAGQQVSVHYTGTLLDGRKFDSSRDRGQPFSFTIGRHQVISGWDEGIALLNKGAKARLFIPSPMAYGGRAAGPIIQPNSILIFDVELMDIR